MSTRDPQQARRLQAEVRKSSPLSFDEAQARLPELVMAELAGEDVDTRFADVFVTFSYYPLLADQYELLLAEMRSDLADPTPVPEPTPSNSFVPRQPELAPGMVLRRLGEQVRGFLVQLMPRPLPQPLSNHLEDEPLAYISRQVTDRDESIQLTVELQPLGARTWALVVLMISDGLTNWQVTATMGGNDLPILSRDPYETRFGPLDTVPTEPMILICQPEAD